MELSIPRLLPPRRTPIQDFILLSHPTMFLPILGFLIAGSFLAPAINYTKLGLLVLGVSAGVILTAYRLNAIKDGGSTLSDRANLLIAAVGAMVFIAILAVSVALWGLTVLLLGALGVFAIVVYNTTRKRVIHNSIVYGICWGGFPVVLSYCFQTLSWPSPTCLALGAAAAIFARAYTWNHGLRSCGVYAICRREKGRHTCHSNSVTCEGRLVMPREVNEHARLRLRMDMGMVLLLGIFVVLLHFKL